MKTTIIRSIFLLCSLSSKYIYTTAAEIEDPLARIEAKVSKLVSGYASPKIRRVIYEYLADTIGDEPALQIVCETIPDNYQNTDLLIINPHTGLPEASCFPFGKREILLTPDIIQRIRNNNFILTEEDKYQILYRATLVKMVEEKFIANNTASRPYMSCVTVALLSFPLALIAWIEEKSPGLNKNKALFNISKKGLLLTGVSALVALILISDRQTNKLLNQKQELLDIMQKAHLFAKSKTSNASTNSSPLNDAVTSLVPLTAFIDQADYQNFKAYLELYQPTTPNMLGQLLAHALFVSNEPCPPDCLEFKNGIYAIIKLLVERGANLELRCEYLGTGPNGKSIDPCGHGTQAVRCSLREFIVSHDYRVTAVKELLKARNSPSHL